MPSSTNSPSLSSRLSVSPVRTRSRQVKPAMCSNAADWKAAAELQVRPTKYLYVDAITYFGRAVGAARSGNAKAAKADIANFVALRDKLKEAKDAYWSNIVDSSSRSRARGSCTPKGNTMRRSMR